MEDVAAEVWYHRRTKGGSRGRQWVGGCGEILAKATAARHSVRVGGNLMYECVLGDVVAWAGAGEWDGEKEEAKCGRAVC